MIHFVIKLIFEKEKFSLAFTLAFSLVLLCSFMQQMQLFYINVKEEDGINLLNKKVERIIFSKNMLKLH